MATEKIEEIEEIEVDLDLDAADAELRSKTGNPTKIRLQGHVLTFPPMDAWEYIWSRQMSIGDYSAWARNVLSDDDFKVWIDLRLKNYQITAIVERILINAGLGSLGKSGGSSGSSPGTSGKSKQTLRGGTGKI
jgi:hypothetical protein